MQQDQATKGEDMDSATSLDEGIEYRKAADRLRLSSKQPCACSLSSVAHQSGKTWILAEEGIL